MFALHNRICRFDAAVVEGGNYLMHASTHVISNILESRLAPLNERGMTYQ